MGAIEILYDDDDDDNDDEAVDAIATRIILILLKTRMWRDQLTAVKQRNWTTVYTDWIGGGYDHDSSAIRFFKLLKFL